jgi:hypothetical protein
MRVSTGPQQGFAITSMILGIASITIGWFCLIGLPTSLGAIILGIFSLVQIKNKPTQYAGKPFAIAGIVTGALYYVLLGVLLLFYGLLILGGAAAGGR